MTAKGLLRAFEFLAWAVFLAVAVLILVLRYWALPNIERFRGDIVSAVSHEIGMQVKVGAIDADWRGMRPHIELSDVRIHDPEGREALVLPAVRSVVSWRSLLYMDLRMHSFEIEGPRLAIRRDARGKIHVAGVRLGEDEGDGRLTDWLLGQNEILIRDAEIEWTDELRGAPPLALSSLQFRLHNDGIEHDIGVSARPPAHLGASLELRARLNGRTVTVPSAWNGRLYAELGYTDLAGWRQWVDYPADVRDGQGALRIWVTLLDGRLTRATADVALSGVVARLGRDLPVLELRSVRGRVLGRETAGGYEFGVRNLWLLAAGGAEMNATSFQARVEGDVPRRSGAKIDENWKPTLGSVTATSLELAPLAHLAEFLPFSADLRKLLAELGPQGTVYDAALEWRGELADAATFKTRARFSGLGMNAWRRLPGFAGLSGSVEATERRGTLQLASQKAQIDLPRVFPEPRIALDALSGQVEWERTGDESVNVRIAQLAFANAHAAGTASGAYLYDGAGPGSIDLTAQLSRADGRHTAKYLPLKAIMGERTRNWVGGAILGGQVSEARVRLKGDLREFPFPGGAKGQFQIAAKFTKGTLDYAEGWPRVENIEGSLHFDNEKMDILGRSGRILGAGVANVRVTIASLVEDEKVLRISGAAEGPLQEYLQFVARSPVRGYIDGVTDPIAGAGQGKLALRLDLPLADLSKTRVNGELRVTANTLTLATRLPPVERAAGTVAFTESSFEVRDLTGQLFGGPVAIGGGTQKDGGVLIAARGTFTPEGIRPVFDHPWRRFASGSAAYAASVTVRAGRVQIGFESPLTGIALALPPPLEKTAQESMPLKVEVVPGEGGAGGGGPGRARARSTANSCACGRARSCACSAPRSRSIRRPAKRCACPSGAASCSTERSPGSISTAGARCWAARAAARAPRASTCASVRSTSSASASARWR